MGVEELIKQATDREITGLPEPSHLTHARVWPSGSEWVAEIGEPPRVKAITAGTGLFNSKDEARAAAIEQITINRERLRDLLPEDLKPAASGLPEPVISIWE